MINEKIEYLIKDISKPILEDEKNNVLRLIENSSELSDLLYNKIYSYFLNVVKSVFDVFICEGGKLSEEYINESINTYYFNIYFFFLKEIFVNNKSFNKFYELEKDKVKVNLLYNACEDLFFNFAVLQYYSCENDHAKTWELLLKQMTLLVKNDETLKRYKTILFIHYKHFEIDKIDNYIKKIKNDQTNMNKYITTLKKNNKINKTLYYEYNKVKKELKNDIKIDDRKTIYDNILKTKEEILKTNKLIKNSEEQKKSLLIEKEKFENLSEDEFVNKQNPKEV